MSEATFPVVIVEDRYTGAYSHGKWLAIDGSSGIEDLGFLMLQDGPLGDDIDAMEFWKTPPDWIAVGDTPDKALESLRQKLEAPRPSH